MNLREYLIVDCKIRNEKPKQKRKDSTSEQRKYWGQAKRKSREKLPK